MEDRKTAFITNPCPLVFLPLIFLSLSLLIVAAPETGPSGFVIVAVQPQPHERSPTSLGVRGGARCSTSREPRGVSPRVRSAIFRFAFNRSSDAARTPARRTRGLTPPGSPEECRDVDRAKRDARCSTSRRASWRKPEGTSHST